MYATFFIVGGLTAVWAVVVAALGLTRRSFPGRNERAVMAVSGVLFVASVVAAVLTAEAEKNTAPAVAKQPPPPGFVVNLAADPTGALHFNTSSLNAPAGLVSIVLSNPSPLDHNMTLSGNGQNAQGPTVGTGRTSTVTANLSPGTYSFFCSVPGHRAGGMQGTLTVH